MIKATANDGELLVFGISEENVRRLKNDETLVIDLKEMGLKGKIVIFYRPTQGDLVQALAEFVGPQTLVHGLKRSGH